MAVPFRFAVCNEIFQPLSAEEICEAASLAGYTGLEIAPFTLAGNPAGLSGEQRAAIRDAMAGRNLSFVGLHWLLRSPEGLHATTPDKALRRRTWDFLRALIDLCSDLKTASEEPAVMVFGSPHQRSSVPGSTPREATQILIDELAAIAPHAGARNVELLLEPLSPDQTDVVTSLEEAVGIVAQIAHPAIRTMFDVHNAAAETTSHTELVARYAPFIRHVHVNEFNGLEPGSGSYDFAALLSTLERLHYRGWISLEVFDFTRDGAQVAASALSFLKTCSHSEALSQTL